MVDLKWPNSPVGNSHCVDCHREYQPQGIHVVHVRIDAILDTPSYKARFASQNEAGELGSCDEIANTYYALYQQSLGCLSNEIDVRPFQEKWSC